MFGVVGVVVAVVAAVAAVHVIGTRTNQCDNMAGTCIRERQKAAIFLIQSTCVLAAVVPLAVAAQALAGKRWSNAVAGTLLVACLAVAVWTLSVDPLPHLNDRWHGWLS